LKVRFSKGGDVLPLPFLGKETNLSTYMSKKMYSEIFVGIFNLLECNYKIEENLIEKYCLCC